MTEMSCLKPFNALDVQVWSFLTPPFDLTHALCVTSKILLFRISQCLGLTVAFSAIGLRSKVCLDRILTVTNIIIWIESMWSWTSFWLSFNSAQCSGLTMNFVAVRIQSTLKLDRCRRCHADTQRLAFSITLNAIDSIRTHPMFRLDRHVECHSDWLYFEV